MWIKICANTNLEDALLGAEAGADAVGFVFAESVRRVTTEQAAAIVPYLPPPVEKVGVFVDASFDDLVKAVEIAGLTGVQLHSGPDTGLAARLREYFGRTLRIIQVVHYRQGLEASLHEAGANAAVDGVLVDSRTAALVGGTGTRYDWNAAGKSFAQAAAGLKLIAAGGLNPENVGQAIATLNPWGVDVATGVESHPGKKDPAKVRAFIENAKIAAHHQELAARTVV